MKKRLFLSYLAAAVLGAAGHFLYELWPNALTALIAPVNESVISGARWSVSTLAANTGAGFGVVNGTGIDSPATAREFVARTCA